MSVPVTHTRAVPVVRAKNTHASHASCNATSTTVTVMRLRMRLKNLMIGNRNSIFSPLPVFPYLYNVSKYSAVFHPLQVFAVGCTGIVPYKKVHRSVRRCPGESRS